jgi:hypothetical protein
MPKGQSEAESHKDKNTTNGLQYTSQKTKDQAIRGPLQTDGALFYILYN